MDLVVVSAAVIERDGYVLVTRRLQGTHLAGCWEFPGGKCERGETLHACLQREIREELGVAIEIGDEVFTAEHVYAERAVRLHFFACTLLGEPQPQLGQDMRWVARGQLHTLDLPEADRGLISLLEADARRAVE